MQTNNNSYLLRLKPLGAFYFGGENTFNTRTMLFRQRKGKAESITNYFSQSRYLPQQSALLGMLRHTILMHHIEGSKLNVSNKADYIGANGFSGTYNDFKIIKTLSPIFILEGKKAWIPAGYDKQIYHKKDKDGKNMKDENGEYLYAPVSFAPPNEESGFTDLQVKMANITLKLNGYDPKEPFEEIWTDGVNMKRLRDFYDSITKAGVNKQQENNAFYKQTFLKLKDKYFFAVILNCIETLPIPKTCMIPFGADQSEYKIESIIFDDSGVSDPFDDKKLVDGELVKFVLLSDAFANESLIKQCDFVVGDTTDFRYIKSELAPVDGYYKGANTRKAEEKANLLQRGAVLFTNNAKQVADLIKGETLDANHNSIIKAYRQIGYNYFNTQKIK